jgi:hypothetical protein
MVFWKKILFIKYINKIPSLEAMNSRIILYNTMHTASFITPSPKSTAKSFGSDSSFMKVKAATVSVAEITLAKRRISFMVNLSSGVFSSGSDSIPILLFIFVLITYICIVCFCNICV